MALGLGVARLATVAMTFLSGFLVPVAMFPEWLRRFVAWTPMPSMVNTPIEVYLGMTTGVGSAIASQVFWLIALTVVCRALFNVGVDRVVSQGG